MIALIDADIIMYRAAFKHEGDETFFECSETIDAMMDYIIHRTECFEYIGFLTGKGNFRYALAKTKEYKGNRKDRERPTFLDEAREYLIEQWECISVDGMEADDALGICQIEMDDDTIICSIDKDLLQIKDNYFNWNSDIISIQSNEDADKVFWKQILMGDSTDNIVGIPRVGKVKAERIIDTALLESDGVGTGFTELYDVCLNAYKNNFESEQIALDKFKETIGLIQIASDKNDDRLEGEFIIPKPVSII